MALQATPLVRTGTGAGVAAVAYWFGLPSPLQY